MAGESESDRVKNIESVERVLRYRESDTKIFK